MGNHCYGDHDDDDDGGGYSVVTSPVHVPSSHVSGGWCHVEATADSNLSHVKYYHDQNDYCSVGLY